MDKSPSSPRPFSAPRYALTLLAVLLAWMGLYVSIQPLSTWLTFDLLSLTPGGAPGLALEFFLYDSAKILLLLVLMVYCIGWLRAGLHVERVRDYLSGKGRGIGYLLGATFGAITPFCSCSSIPLFLGFTELLLQINDLLLTGLDLLNSGDGILQLSQRFTVAALMRQQGEEHQHKCRQKQNQDVDDDGLFAGIRRFGGRGHVSSVGSFFKFHEIGRASCRERV